MAKTACGFSRSLSPGCRPRPASASAVAFLIFGASLLAQPADHPGKWDAITDVAGVRVGHYTVREGTLRGVTATLFDGGAICGIDVRGGNPVTSGDSTFNPVNIGEECDAVSFSGGSAFGLAAATGITDYLAEHGMGIRTEFGLVPIVPAAVIYDLRMDQGKHPPTRDWGYAAAKAAASAPLEMGNVGAGAGATTGKWSGGLHLKGGVGTASVVLSEGVTVGVLIVVNALGDVVNPKTGRFYATDGGFDQPMPPMRPGAAPQNTTLVLIATDARLTKPQLTRVAQLAHDGLARAIRPIHTMQDGDAAYAASVGFARSRELRMPASMAVDRIGNAGADVVVRAVLKAVEAAESVPGFPSYKDWIKNRPAQ